MTRATRRKAMSPLVAAVLTTALLLAASGTAQAGTYTIRGTCGLWDAFNSTPDRLAVFPQCHGLATRNTRGNFTTPHGAQGGWSFSAPPGTTVDSFSLAAYMLGTNGWHATGFRNGGYLNGVPFENCPGSACPGRYKALDGRTSYPGGGANSITVRLRCGYASGCVNYGHEGYFNIDGSSITLADASPPGVRITGGTLMTGGWRRGTDAVAYDAGDNVGIKLVRAFVDGRPRSEEPRRCDYARKVPCPNGGGSLSMATAGLADGAHTLTVQAVDTADNAGETAASIYTDNTPPVQPQQTTLDGGDAWRALNRFRMTWSNPPQNASPIAAASYLLCPASNAPRDTRGCVGGARAATNIADIADLAVPKEGAWTLRLWLRDAAGNENPDSAVIIPSLRYDATPPELAFLGQDPADPARVRVRATDATSGIGRAEIELQRDGDAAWRPVPVEANAEGFTAVLDDGNLPDGTYRLRARAVDLAGNERSTDALADGRPVTIALPARIKTRLAVGKVKRVRAKSSRGGRPRYRRILVGRPRTRFPRTVQLHGRLTTPGANPIAGADVEVWEQARLPGATWSRVATVRSSRTGRFTFKALRGPSRLIRFTYPGTSTVRARSTIVDLRVRAATSFRVNRRRAANGESVMFRGRLKGGPVPADGKLVELQVYSRRRWRTFAQPRADAGTGLWRFPYRFEAVQGRVIFRFRARVRKEAAYPYELGWSRQRAVTVTGL